jgi:hypothetical protein
MNIISFDIGAKNLAFCVLNVKENNEYNILLWDVIDICVEDEKKSCCYMNCKTLPKYTRENKYYCMKHAKQYNKYIVPPKHKKLIKMKLNELKELFDELYNKNTIIFYDDLNKNKDKISKKKLIKKDYIELIEKELREKYYEPIITKKAADVSLVTMGKNMKLKLDRYLENINIDVVLIENQISPIANRMKTLQGMVAQYFIMNNVDIVEFISSSNKLRNFEGKKSNYKDRKALSIKVMNEILDKLNKNTDFDFFINNNLKQKRETNWKHLFENHKKKDDLADSFLQALWYIENQMSVN